MTHKIGLIIKVLFVTILFTGCGGGGNNNSDQLQPNPTDNKPPQVQMANSIEIQENTVSVLTVVVDDPENDPLNFALDSNAADSVFLRMSSNGVLEFKQPPRLDKPLDKNADNIYETHIYVSDAFTRISIKLNVTVVNAGVDVKSNTAPQLTDALQLIAIENVDLTIDIPASDNEGDPISIEISGGEDQLAFYTSDNSELIVFNAVPNYENPDDSDSDNIYNISLKLSDGELSSYYDIAIQVVDANDAPQSRSAGRVTILENETYVQQLTATDEDGDSPLTFSIVKSSKIGPDGDLFTISDTGVLSFKEAPPLNNPITGQNQYKAEYGVSDGRAGSLDFITVNIQKIIAEIDTGFGDVDPNNTDQRIGYVTQAQTTQRGETEFVRDAAIMSTNKVVVVGFAAPAYYGAISQRHMVVWRYTEQGELDTDLATGFGELDPTDNNKRLGYVSHRNTAGGGGGEEANGVAITNDDKIIVVGYSYSNGDFESTTDSVVWKYTSDGQLDTSFGAVDPNDNSLRLGYTTHSSVSNQNANDNALAVVVANDNSIFLTGYTSNNHVQGSSIDMAIWKYTPQGELDTGFGFLNADSSARLGYVSLSDGSRGSVRGWGQTIGNDIVITPSGKIIVVGKATRVSLFDIRDELIVWQFTAQGVIDRGNFGYPNSNINKPTGFYYHGEATGVRDEILASATAVSLNQQNHILVVTNIDSSMVVLRLNKNGELLGLTNPRNPRTNTVGYDIKVMPDNKILVLGSQSGGVALWRFEEFGVFNGEMIDAAIRGNNQDLGIALALSNDNKIVAAGYNYFDKDFFRSDKYQLFVKRYNTVN